MEKDRDTETDATHTHTRMYVQYTYIYIYVHALQQHPLPLLGIHAVRLFANDISHFAGGDHVRREAEADLGGAHRSPGEADGGLSGALERPKSWPKQVPFPELGSPEKEE